MERSLRRNGLVNLLMLLVAAAATWALAGYAQSAAGQIVAALLGLGVLVAAVSLLQIGLEAREQIERMEFDEATRGPTGSSLFNAQQSETFPARRAREQFERLFIPAFTIVLCLIEGVACGFFWRWLQQQPPVSPLVNVLLAMAVFALLALLLFILGLFSAGLARLGKQRLISPSANWLLLGAYLLGLLVVALIGFQTGFPRVEYYLAFALAALLGLLSLENLVALVLEIYRPRVKGRPDRLLYESRFVGLLSHPENLFTTAAHTLDYQFGFKVSETWFYKFLEKAFVWLVLGQLALLWLSGCFVFIEVGQEALLERFGRPVGRGVIGPGFHLKLPWPIDRVRRFRTLEVQTFHIGVKEEEGESHQEATTILWTVSHYKEAFNLLVATRERIETNVLEQTAGKRSPPVNLLAVNIPVQFQISDLRAWAYHHQDPAALLERLGTREVVRYLASADLGEMISTARFTAGDELRQRIQARADELQLGVKILFLGLYHSHPPVEVARSYDALVGSKQRSATEVLKAEAHRVQTNRLANADALRRVREAEATRVRLVASAEARAGAFSNQVSAFRAAPEVYTQRSYLQALTEGAAGARKFVLATTNTDDVLIMNLEEKIRPDIQDVPLPALKNESRAAPP